MTISSPPQENANPLTTAPIGPVLVKLSAPMLVGILAMMAFNLVDTFFVGRLGTLPLAAMTLTFPVIMVIGMFTLGLGVGAMAVISQGIGAGDRQQTRRTATDALILAGVCVVVLTLIGLASLEPLFRLLGATEAMMPLIRQYMLVWYLGMPFYAIPMVGNNIIRATGDTLTPSIVMVAGVALNAVLDPILIFGWGPIEALGIGGAAVATVVARAMTLIVVLWILGRREHLLVLSWPGTRVLWHSMKTILRIGLPVAVSNAIIPLAMGLVTRIITQFGPATVAGFGVATRIEGFGMSLVYAVATGISPFVGQNFGAGRFDRIHRAFTLIKAFCMAWGLLLAVTFWMGAGLLATWFNPDPEVMASARLYLWIVPISLGLRSIHQMAWTALNVLNRPYDALALEFLLAFVLWIPLAYLGAHFAEDLGVYSGLALANLLAGVTAYVWIDRVTRKLGGRRND
ncbi:MAG: MATE family efflux transporter [Chloroflexi bacterium]|nr:MATE family efflux transporter [Chloroflexota bacterium]